MSAEQLTESVQVACFCGAIVLPDVGVQHNDQTTAHTSEECWPLGICGRCEDGCVHGTTTPCPHCKGRMVTAHVEREAVAGALAAHAWRGGVRQCSCGLRLTAASAHLDHLADAVLAALPQTGDAAVEVEVREIWALRWPDGETSSGMYSDDGSDYAEQAIRKAAGDFEVVHRTETITRTPWETAAALTAGADQ